MTSSSSAPRSTPLRPIARRLRPVAVVLALLAVGIGFSPRAHGGEDDFEFGKKLAEARYFDYARKVYDRVLGDPNRNEEDKGEARYGLALLRKEEALAATGQTDAKYADIVNLFDSAADDIREFVEKNPKNRNATQARLDVGTIRLAFVQWARELLEDEGSIREREAYGFEVNRLAEDAQRSVEQAIEYFGGLRPDPSDNNPQAYEVLASYYYVICQYYKALVEPKCSPSAMSALEKAGNDLEEYIMDHDGQLLAVYAQDIYGLVWWELARCAEDPEQKLTYFNKAFEWFETCIYTEDEGPDHLRVITSGYYHIAQAGLDAGRMTERNFARDALDHLKSMLKDHPTAWREVNGLRAMVEWAKLECDRGNANEAVKVAREAAERARAAGKPSLERLANRQLNVFVSGGCGGTVSGLDPEVLRRVADDLYLRGQFQDAVRAYRTVISSSSPTTQDFLAFRWHAWERMAAGYRQLGDRLGEALAFEPIHDAWMRGQIPRTSGQEDDPNLLRAGHNRRAAQVAVKELADRTGSAVLQQRYKEMRDEFLRDYPGHPSTRIGEWNAALDKWKQARAQRTANNSRWTATMDDARGHFANVAQDEKSERQDLAWVYLVRCDYEEGKYDAAAQTAEKAFGYWESAAAKEQEEKFPTVRTRRTEARAAATYWWARSRSEQGKHAEVLALLTDYHSKYPDVSDPYPSLAYDILVQASLEQGNIEEADRFYRILLRRDPKYFNLQGIVFLLAGHYNDERAEIEKRLRDLKTRLNEARTQLREAERQSLRLGSLVADLKNRYRKAEQAVKMWEDGEKEGTPELERGVDKGTYNEAQATIQELDKRIPEEEARLGQWAPKRDSLQEQVGPLLEQRAALEQEIYPPLVRAATYYREWNDALKKVDVRRDPANVKIFGDLFWQAGRLRPELLENWQAARDLYEDYLSFPQVKQKPITDEDKRAAVARLGDVYVSLATQEQDPDTRGALVMKAIDGMQKSLAEEPRDNELVVGMLEDKILVLRWRDPTTGVRWRFPIPRPRAVKELRDSVHELAPPEGATEQEKRTYRRALQAFQRVLAGQNDSDLKRLLVEEGKSTFDPILYRELADTSVDFRLALAWAYSQSGREADEPKSVNLALSLVAGPLAVAEDTPEWWRAREIQLDVYLAAAERRLTAGGTATSDAAQWLERAGQVFLGVAANFPDLGESLVTGNKPRWLKILERMNGLRTRAQMSSIEVALATAPAPGAGTDENE